jgi:hypothetical protein
MVDVSLTDIVVVNESRDLRVAGDVSVFRSARDACSYLEHWWVQDGEGFVFSATGERLLLSTAGTAVIIIGKEAVSDGAEIVRNWLEATAVAVLAARRHRAARGKLVLSPSEELGQLPTSMEALLGYVGFTR